MSNHRPTIQTIFVTLLLLAVPAAAQSPELIEAVRVHRPTALDTAKAELSACGACPAASRLSLLTGFLMLSAGDPRGAVAQLGAKPAPKGLEAFAAWYLAIAKAYSGDRPGALKAIKAIGKGAPEWLKKKAAVRTGELFLQQGDAKKALPLLEAAAGADDLPELLYGRGVARLYGGQAEKGLADLKAVLVRFPAHPHAALALERLTAAKKAPVFSVDDRFTREAALLAAGDPKAAAAELDAIEVPTGTGRKVEATKASLALARATVLFALGQEKEAYEKIDAAMGGPTWVAASAMMVRARRLLRNGDNTAARALMLQLDQKYPNEAPADEAAYLAGWIAMQAGDFPNAVKDFTAFEERHADSKKRDEARWFRAYSQIRQDQWAEARATIATLLADFPKSQLVPQAKYWSARCGQLLAGKADAGVSATAIGGELRDVVATSPGSFYALLAQQRLRESGAEVPQVFVEGARTPDGGTAAPADLKLAQELSKAGLLRDAWEETQARVAAVGGAADALRYGHALQAIGEFGGAHALAARHLWGAVYTQRNPEAVALMYPRAYRESVERLSKERGLDPFFAWAIMRRESAFKPEVFSTADARGLMQLIPPTAKAVAAELKIPPPDPDELYSPEANIALGTWYLAALLDRFGGHPSLAAAAYNGGPTPVVKWALAKGNLPLDMWVEEIPYKETRGYVKQVTADYFIYQALYGGKPPPPLPMGVPVPKDGGVSF